MKNKFLVIVLLWSAITYSYAGIGSNYESHLIFNMIGMNNSRADVKNGVTTIVRPLPETTYLAYLNKGRFSKTLNFLKSGTSYGYIHISTATNFPQGSAASLTFIFDVYIESYTYADPIVLWYGDGVAGSLYVYFANSSKPFRLGIGNYANFNDSSADNVWKYNTWYHVAIVRKNSDGETFVKGYLDGKLVVTQTTIKSLPATVTYFHVPDPINSPLLGSICNFRMYDISFSKGQIEQEYDSFLNNSNRMINNEQ